MLIESQGKILSGLVVCPECKLQQAFIVEKMEPGISCKNCGEVFRCRVDMSKMEVEVDVE